MEDHNFISEETVKDIARKTGLSPSDVLGIGTFYQFFSFHPAGTHVIRPCLTNPCLCNGGKKLFRALTKTLGIGIEETTKDGLFTLRPAQCLGQCAEGPSLMIDEDVYLGVTPEALPEILSRYQKSGRMICSVPVPVGEAVQGKTVVFDALSSPVTVEIEGYLKRGGYDALKKVLSSFSPDAVIEEIRQSGLGGRGGADYSTGAKLGAVRKHEGTKYVVANADEGEPGTFKDRYIMERNPHSLIEGMIIAGYAVGANLGYIYLRAEYPGSFRILEKALKEAKEKGFLGKSVMESPFSFDIRLYRGAGAYICGEESSLINSLEGKRGLPRNKPPRITDVGLWGRPTDVQNVETLANIPPILLKGGSWYQSLGDEATPGTKLFCLSGHIARPGLYEVPFGMSLREVIMGLGGGIRGGRSLKAILPAGSASRMLLPEHLDISLDYPSVSLAGSFLGSASVIVFDDTTCMVDLAYWMSAFSHHESCGQCTPCRDGTEDSYEILDKIVHGQGTPEMFDLLTKIGGYMMEASICGLGKSAPSVPLSALEYFREEWMSHVRDHVCPAGVCSMAPAEERLFSVRRSSEWVPVGVIKEEDED